MLYIYSLENWTIRLDHGWVVEAVYFSPFLLKFIASMATSQQCFHPSLFQTSSISYKFHTSLCHAFPLLAWEPAILNWVWGPGLRCLVLISHFIFTVLSSATWTPGFQSREDIKNLGGTTAPHTKGLWWKRGGEMRRVTGTRSLLWQCPLGMSEQQHPRSLTLVAA